VSGLCRKPTQREWPATREQVDDEQEDGWGRVKDAFRWLHRPSPEAAVKSRRQLPDRWCLSQWSVDRAGVAIDLLFWLQVQARRRISRMFSMATLGSGIWSSSADLRRTDYLVELPRDYISTDGRFHCGMPVGIVRNPHPCCYIVCQLLSLFEYQIAARFFIADITSIALIIVGSS